MDTRWSAQESCQALVTVNNQHVFVLIAVVDINIGYKILMKDISTPKVKLKQHGSLWITTASSDRKCSIL